MSTETFKAAMKLNNGEEEIRSLNLTFPFEYDNMMTLLKKVFNLPDIKIKAADEDNELVTLTSSEDLANAYKVAKERNNKLKVWVHVTGPQGPKPVQEEEKGRPKPLARSESTNSENGFAGMSGSTPRYVPRKDREVAFVDPGSAKRKVPFTPTNGSAPSPAGSNGQVTPTAGSLVPSLSSEFPGVTLCMDWLNDGCPLPEGECPKAHLLSANWKCKNCNQTGHRLPECPTKVCSYYAKTRTCRRGDKCPLSHDAVVTTAVLASPRTMRADQARDWRDKDAIKALSASQSLGAMSGIPRHPGTTPRLASSASKDTLNATLGASASSTALNGNAASSSATGSGNAPNLSGDFVKALQQLTVNPTAGQNQSPEALAAALNALAQVWGTSANTTSAAQSQAPAQLSLGGAPGGPTVTPSSPPANSNSDSGSPANLSPKKPRRTMASYAVAATGPGDITSPQSALGPTPMTIRTVSEGRDISALRKTKACRHWTEKGHCKLGDSCNFRHDPQLQNTGLVSPDSARSTGSNTTTPRVPCKFFQTNTCRNGNDCRWLHVLSPTSLPATGSVTGTGTINANANTNMNTRPWSSYNTMNNTTAGSGNNSGSSSNSSSPGTTTRSKLSPHAASFTYIGNVANSESTTGTLGNTNTGALNSPRRCELCNEQFTSALQVQTHEAGSAHQLALIRHRAKQAPAGSACENCHETSHNTNDCNFTVCGHYARGNCPRGSSCNRQHVAAPVEVAA